MQSPHESSIVVLVWLLWLPFWQESLVTMVTKFTVMHKQPWRKSGKSDTAMCDISLERGSLQQYKAGCIILISYLGPEM